MSARYGSIEMTAIIIIIIKVPNSSRHCLLGEKN